MIIMHVIQSKECRSRGFEELEPMEGLMDVEEVQMQMAMFDEIARVV